MSIKTKKTTVNTPLSLSAELLIEQAKVDAVLHKALGGIFALDKNGKILSLNIAAETLFNITSNKVLGTHINNVVKLVYTNDFLFFESIESQINSGMIINYQEQLLTKNTEETLVEITAGKIALEPIKPAKNLTNLGEYIIVIQKSSNKAQSEYNLALNQLSHNIKTPTFGLLGTLTLALNDQTLNPETRSLLEKASQAGEQINNLINRSLSKKSSKNNTFSTNSFKPTTSVTPININHPIKKNRILIVEDNKVNQLIAVSMFKKLNLPVDLADNGEAAIKATNKTDYKLIFMDCNLPGMDGIETTAKIREKEDTDQRTPIIAFTANHITDKEKFCEAANMDDFLSKPYKIHELNSMLSKWFYLK